jgi:hypothetical protein
MYLICDKVLRPEFNKPPLLPPLGLLLKCDLKHGNTARHAAIVIFSKPLGKVGNLPSFVNELV